jgi:hypothetical protein
VFPGKYLFVLFFKVRKTNQDVTNEVSALKQHSAFEIKMEKGPFVFQNLQADDNRSVLLQITQPWNNILILLILLSLIWGTLMKTLVYYYLKKLKIREKPINLLILLDQVLISSTFYEELLRQ